MRIVVTGGAGFIGANLCRTLLADGHSVVALDDLSTGNAANLDGLDVEFVEGSVLDPTVLDRACTDATSIAHLAALGSVPRSMAEPLATLTANAMGTAQVLEAARRHGGLHTVIAGSSSVYGANPALPKHEELLPAPMSPYAASKVATESFATAWARAYELPVLPFRFFNVFGPLQSPRQAYAAAIPLFIDAALSGRPLTIHGDGLQTRDFTYVGTVTAVLADALARRVTADAPVNLAFGSQVTLLDLIAEIEDVLGTPVQRLHEPPRAGDVRHSQARNDRLLALFPDARPVPLRPGLEATVAWMRTQVAPTP